MSDHAEDASNSVFLLWHVCRVNDDEDEEDEKLIGVYRTEEDAKAAIARLIDKPGFIDTQDGFQYHKYELNRDHWTDGFVWC